MEKVTCPFCKNSYLIFRYMHNGASSNILYYAVFIGG